MDNIKAYFSHIFENIYDWLKMREHNPYHYKYRLGYVLTTLFLLALSFVAFILLYTNADKLHSINLWIFRLEGVLLLISAFFVIKYGYRTIEEIINWLKRQRNWLKYLIIVILLLFLWQVYVQRDTALNPLFNIYNKTNFSYFNPFIMGSGDSNSKIESSVSQVWEGLKNTVTVPERDYPLIESRILDLVNQERSKYGVSALRSNANLNSLARGWSEKMIAENFFEHGKKYNVGENIGEVPIHYNVLGCGSTYSNEAMAQCFVTGWIESSGHHQNMVDRSYTSTGVGVACDISKCRATQMFS